MANQGFAELSPEERATIREKQKLKKQGKKAQANAGMAGVQTNNGSDDKEAETHVSAITREQYFRACAGLFRDPNLQPTEDNVSMLLSILNSDDANSKRLSAYNYFQFVGSKEAIWEPRFNARLAWEGFFTITTRRRWQTEPLPEFQPFYSVLTWPNFEKSKHVRQALGKLRRSDSKYWIVNCRNPQRTWDLLDAYHRKKYGSNWLTREYFAMLVAANADPAINFRMHCIELFALSDAVTVESLEAEVDDSTQSQGNSLTRMVQLFSRPSCWESAASSASRSSTRDSSRPIPVAGEVGFSFGGVYTSLSGWTEERTAEGLGTAQLVLLGRWLQQRGYAFWSLGHCYSPEMDYKRQVGHRVYPRKAFLDFLHKHRGPFDLTSGQDPAPGARLLESRQGILADKLFHL